MYARIESGLTLSLLVGSHGLKVVCEFDCFRLCLDNNPVFAAELLLHGEGQGQSPGNGSSQGVEVDTALALLDQGQAPRGDICSKNLV